MLKCVHVLAVWVKGMKAAPVVAKGGISTDTKRNVATRGIVDIIIEDFRNAAFEIFSSVGSIPIAISHLYQRSAFNEG